MKIFICNPTRINLKSTDHDYIHKRFVRLKEFQDVDFILNEQWLTALHRNGIYAKQRFMLALRNSKIVLTQNAYSDAYFCGIPNNADLVFAYGGFPVELGKRSGKPVICEQTWAYGGRIDENTWTEYIRSNRRLYVEKADLLITPSHESVFQFQRIFPKFANKIQYAPYFLPDLRAITEVELRKKFDELSKIRFLFVGKEAKRKGLDKFVTAYLMLPKELKNRIEVTVVSKFLDGLILLPPEFIYKPYVEDIHEEFNKAHVLVFLTRQEAYGLVLVEGMSKGCNILTTNHPIQRSILSNQGGWFVDPYSEEEISTALVEIIASPKDKLQFNARSNIQNFVEDKSAEVVSLRYKRLFESML